MDDSMFLFDTQTPLGFRVHVSENYWNIIVTIKHPVMVNHLTEVIEAISDPDEVRQSRSDQKVYLFY